MDKPVFSEGLHSTFKIFLGNFRKRKKKRKNTNMFLGKLLTRDSIVKQGVVVIGPHTSCFRVFLKKFLEKKEKDTNKELGVNRILPLYSLDELTI